MMSIQGVSSGHGPGLSLLRIVMFHQYVATVAASQPGELPKSKSTQNPGPQPDETPCSSGQNYESYRLLELASQSSEEARTLDHAS